MITLIKILLVLLFAICLGLFILHKYDSEEIVDLKDRIRKLESEVSSQKSRQWIFEQKLIKLSNEKDRIEIVHKYDDSDSPRYGGF